jgi:hypothetical protein
VRDRIAQQCAMCGECRSEAEHKVDAGRAWQRRMEMDVIVGKRVCAGHGDVGAQCQVQDGIDAQVVRGDATRRRREAKLINVSVSS